MNEEKWKVTAAYCQALVELMDKQDNISAAFDDVGSRSADLYSYFKLKTKPKYQMARTLIKWFSGQAGAAYMMDKGHTGTPEEFVRVLCFTFSDKDGELVWRPRKREQRACVRRRRSRKPARKKVKCRATAAKSQSTPDLPNNTIEMEPVRFMGAVGDMAKLNAKIESLVTELKKAINERTMLEIMTKVM